MRVTLKVAPSHEERQKVLQGLAAVNQPLYGQSNSEPLATLLYNEVGELVGGALGRTHWGWLYIEALWVAEAFRRQGYGAELLTRAEAEARRRGCRHAYLDTFSADAQRFYEGCGYTLFTIQTDFPPGHQRYFLRKELPA